MSLSAGDLAAIEEVVARAIARALGRMDPDPVRRDCNGKRWPDRPTESDAHRELVAELLVEGAATSGFRRAVEAALGVRLDRPLGRVVPDAYKLETSSRTVIVYEVCVAHWITGRKRAALRTWRAWLAEHGWSIRLVRVTVEGRVGIDLDHGDLDYQSRRDVVRVLTEGQ